MGSGVDKRGCRWLAGSVIWIDRSDRGDRKISQKHLLNVRYKTVDNPSYFIGIH